MSRSAGLHLGLVALLAGLQFALPAYHHGMLARVMVLAVYAMGYNLLFGYTGLLSLGHAMFFAAGMYGMGLPVLYLGVPVAAGFVLGVMAAAALALAVGLLALRTIGVAFMIVTLMFAQAGYLVILYFGALTHGDEGLVIPQAVRQVAGLDLSDPHMRYWAAFGLFAAALALTLRLVHTRAGRVLVAIRENSDRAGMLGYDVRAFKLMAVVLSGTFAGAAGAAYGILFGYVGASFAAVPYSIFPLLWVLLGGPGTVLGPFAGTLFMTYLIDITSTLTDAYMLIVGVALVLLTLYARHGLLGLIRERWWRWLP